MKTPYTYTVLRYVHDVATGEALNVGVVLHAPAVRYLGARIQQKYGRLTHAFPGMNGDVHRALMRQLQAAFDAAAERYAHELPFSGQSDCLETRLHEVLRPDDSSLQWGCTGGGLTAEPAAELEHLYHRFVALHDPAAPRHGRTDDAVWGRYRAPLQAAAVLSHLQAHRVASQVEEIEVEFPNAWRNGQWHLLHPFSLDLVDPDNIREKSHKLIGQMAALRPALEGDHLYLMLGEPEEKACRVVMERSLNLIHQSLGMEHTIVREREAEAFSRQFGAKVRAHQQDKAG